MPRTKQIARKSCGGRPPPPSSHQNSEVDVDEDGNGATEPENGAGQDEVEAQQQQQTDGALAGETSTASGMGKGRAVALSSPVKPIGAAENGDGEDADIEMTDVPAPFPAAGANGSKHVARPSGFASNGAGEGGGKKRRRLSFPNGRAQAARADEVPQDKKYKKEAKDGQEEPRRRPPTRASLGVISLVDSDQEGESESSSVKVEEPSETRARPPTRRSLTGAGAGSSTASPVAGPSSSAARPTRSSSALQPVKAEAAFPFASASNGTPRSLRPRTSSVADTPSTASGRGSAKRVQTAAVQTAGMNGVSKKAQRSAHGQDPEQDLKPLVSPPPSAKALGKRPARHSPSPSPLPDVEDEEDDGYLSTASSSAGLSQHQRNKKYAPYAVSDTVKEVLNMGNDGRSTGYKKMSGWLIPFVDLRTVEGSDQGPIRAGEIVEVKTTIEGVGGWYLAVEEFRALNSDLQSTPPEASSSTPGKPAVTQQKANTVYCKGSWLYGQKDLRDMAEATKALAFLKTAVHPMGPNERIKTTHCEWRDKGLLKSTGPETLYVFDDCYPAAPPGASERSDHPLSHYRTSALLPLQSSPYASPALQTPNPSSKSSTSASASSRPPVPDFFFGVGSSRGSEGRRSELLEPAPKGKKLDKEREEGEDGRRGIAYVRVGFSFEPQQDEDGAGKKKERGKKGKGRIREPHFNKHSLSEQPYNPRHVQHFSRRTSKWYDVGDLKEGKHFKPISASSSAAPAALPSSAATSPTKSVKKSARKDGAVNFWLDIPVGQPSQSSASTSAGAAASRAPISGGSGGGGDGENDDRSRASSRSLGEFFPSEQTLAERKADTLARLRALATSPIVRGGAYGLTGNAFLVVSAETLVALLDVSRGSEQDLEYAEKLLVSHAAWEAGVQDRVDGKGDGRGLAKEWRKKGEPPKGCRWVCPESGEAI
ncbi:hypothetical protein JCM10213v2_002795 [Rhodosporidiobolus nylandii]